MCSKHIGNVWPFDRTEGTGVASRVLGGVVMSCLGILCVCSGLSCVCARSVAVGAEMHARPTTRKYCRVHVREISIVLCCVQLQVRLCGDVARLTAYDEGGNEHIQFPRLVRARLELCKRSVSARILSAMRNLVVRGVPGGARGNARVASTREAARRGKQHEPG